MSSEELREFMSNFESELTTSLGCQPAEFKAKQEEIMKHLESLSTEDFEQQQQELFQSLKKLTPEQLQQRQEEILRSFEDQPEMREFLSQIQQQIVSMMGRDNIEPFLRPLIQRYPDWLRDHESVLDSTERTRYEAQLNLMRQILAAYERPSARAEEVVEETVRLFTELQQYGKVPTELLTQVVPPEYLESYNALTQGNLPFVPPPTIPRDPNRNAPSPALSAAATPSSPLSSPAPPATSSAIEGNQCSVM